MTVREDVIVLVHGRPVAQAADTQYVQQHTCHCHGVYGPSSMERLSPELSLTGQTRVFKQIRRP